MDPPIEDLLDKVDSKFTLVALASRRARQVNSYYNSLGEGIGVVVPPQVASASGKPLSIAFEEVAAGQGDLLPARPRGGGRRPRRLPWRCSRAWTTRGRGRRSGSRRDRRLAGPDGWPGGKRQGDCT